MSVSDAPETTVSSKVEAFADIEARAEVASPSRRAALIFGAALPVLLLASQVPARAEASFGLGEKRALQFLEEFENMQTEFFSRVAASAAFDGMEERERSVFAGIGTQDREHAEWFVLARRKYGIAQHSRPFASNLSSSRPVTIWNFPLDAYNTRAALLPVASMMKDTAVGIYHHFVGAVGDGEVAQALAALAGIEGRHAAALHEIAGTDPFTGALEPTVTPQVARTRFERYGFRGEAIQ
ncbi:MAG TPA: ferritin-like domain-containing protein [Abditibacteriaceae bacterium]|jgi:hypothetical protein